MTGKKSPTMNFFIRTVYAERKADMQKAVPFSEIEGNGFYMSWYFITAYRLRVRKPVSIYQWSSEPLLPEGSSHVPRWL